MNKTSRKIMRPNCEEVIVRWDAFWAGDNDSPMVWANCPRQGEEINRKIESLAIPYPIRPGADYDRIAHNLVELNEDCIEWVGDEMPSYAPSFGPDQFAGFLGVPIEYSPYSAATNWSVPIPLEIEELLPITLQNSNKFYQEMEKFITTLAETSDGRFIIGNLDMHSNFDALAAMRGPENACFDLIEKPELVMRALSEIGIVYKQLAEHFYELGNMANTGCSSWLQAYSSRKFQTLACDFICLLSPEMANKFVIPYLEEELCETDDAIFHLDGATALQHLDSLLSLKKLHTIQWQPGDGYPQAGPEWFDLYHKILNAGKGLWIHGSIDAVREIHRELQTNHVIYLLTNGTSDEVRSLIDWFRD